MRKKEVYRTVTISDQDQQVQCELCEKPIDPRNLIEISSNKDSTVLCSTCAVKLNNLTSLYDE
jgi:hypothetical protein